MFNYISSIESEISSTYKNELFVTIDMDWAPDYILEDTYSLLFRHNIKSTWMVTHKSPFLDVLIKSEIIELGIHPNFNDFFDTRNSTTSDNAYDRIVSALTIVPNAKSVRSHSMTQNSRILDIFSNLGITHDCNHYIPFNSGIILKPWRIWNGLIKVPFGWEDDLDFPNTSRKFAQNVVSFQGLRVLNFHPIHLFLNSSSNNAYEKTRSKHGSPEIMKNYINLKYGTRTFLNDLISISREQTMST